MTEYKYIHEGQGHYKECESCGWVAPLAQFEREGNTHKMTCEVCASTLTGKASDYGFGDVELYINMAQSVNLLLDKLLNRKP